jgi:guanylate kinase
MSPAPAGLIIVVSAPSGGGKGTILARVSQADARLRHTVSATTRAPRPGEVEGKHYYFVNRQTFDRWVGEGRFAEWADVHGQRYGTLRAELDRVRGAGDAVLELDVQGMRSIRAVHPDAVTIFLLPPSMRALEERLRKRGDLSPEALAVRLRNAEAEIAAKNEYTHAIVNDDLDAAVAEFQAILRTERAKAARPGANM